MRVVLDANEFVIAFRSEPGNASRRVLAALRPRAGPRLRIARTIVDEVQGNLTHAQRAAFFAGLARLTTIDEDWTVPGALPAKYHALGLKVADAFIAAYAEHVDADFLVSENRHFLSRRGDLPFRVVSAEEFVQLLEGGDDD